MHIYKRYLNKCNTVGPLFCEPRLCETLDLLYNGLCTVGQTIWQTPC